MADVVISLPDDLLARIDAVAPLGREALSEFLAVAATRELDRTRREGMNDAIVRARDAMTDVPALGAAAVIRAERDTH